MNCGSTYTEAGATATDETAPANPSVVISGTVNTTKPGNYTVTYTATDVGADGYSPLMKYALGANSPTDTNQAPVLSSTATTLVLTATVTTNDAKLTLIGEAVDSLTGTWGTGGTVTNTSSANQTNLPSGGGAEMISWAGSPSCGCSLI